MSKTTVADSEPLQPARCVYFFWLVGSVLGCTALLSVGFFLFGLFRTDTPGAARQALKIDPQDLRLEDRIYDEGDQVRGTYHLLNDSSEPVTVVALHTSCSCVASVAEEGRKFPVVMPPHSNLAVTLMTTAIGIQGMEQRYQAVVETTAGGQRLADSYASLFFRVSDVLKANPRELRIHEADDKSPTVDSISLYTYRGSSEVQRPAVKVKGSKSISAAVREPAGKEKLPERMVARYVVDVMIRPQEDSDTVTGEVEIEPKGQPRVTVPVSCSFRRDVRLQPSAIDATGPPGAVVERDVFEEFTTDNWRQFEVVSKPDRCKTDVAPFDSRTNKIHVKIVMPTASQAAAPGEAIVLVPRDRSRSIRIPIRYTLDQ